MTRILVADDHEYLRVGIETVLSTMGYDVVACLDDGDAALEAIARLDPDVVILDVRMPRLGGVATLETMRKSGDDRPVIFLTAELEDANLVAALGAKVNGIVFKDDSASGLQRGIDAVLAGEQFVDPKLLNRALAIAMDRPRGGRLTELSPKERQIVEAVAVGKRNAEIALAFDMTVGSLKVMLHRLYDKLGVENRTELAVLVMRESGG